MYCYTIAQNYGCIIEELLLWSNTSKEHPTVLLTFAELSGKTLSPEIEEMLATLHDQFAEIERQTLELRQSLYSYSGYYLIPQRLPLLIRQFLRYDNEFIRVLEVMQENDGNGVWQVLLEHIQDEQEYMGRLFRTLLYQLRY